MIVAVHLSVARVLWRFHNACLMVGEHNIPHPLKRHADSLALLNHIVYFLKPGHGLRGHAYTLILMCSLAIYLREFGNAARTVGHLIS